MAKKIAYIRVHSHPINDSIVRMLAKQFPMSEVVVIDVGESIKKDRTAVLTNTFFVFKEYGSDILRGKKEFKECFWRTTYIFKEIKELMSNILSPDDYAFSFQNQSLFDASKAGLPHYVYTDHTHLANLGYPSFNKEDLYSKRWIELEKTIYHNATLNFTRNSFAERSIIRDYSCPSSKVFCAYAGTNITTSPKVDERKYSSKNILFVGVDWERKGGPELVEAFRHVLKVHPSSQLTIVGCRPRLKISNINVVGAVTRQEMSRYYEKASVFCLPSRIDLSPNVILEASAHALPIVATEIGGIPDRVLDGETGYLVKYGDVGRLAEVLTDLVGNGEKCKALGERGKRFVAEKYNWEKVGTDIAKRIVASSGRCDVHPQAGSNLAKHPDPQSPEEIVIDLRGQQKVIELRLATAKDYPDIIDFRNRHYETKRKPEHGIWEYATYEPDKTVFLLAHDTDGIVGTAATIPIYMQVGAESSLSGKVEQLFIVPRYRGSALFMSSYRQLLKISAIRGMKLLWILTPLKGLPNRMGARSFEDIQVLTRPGNMWVDIVSRLQWDTTIWGRIGSAGKAILKDAFMRNSRTVPYIHKQAGYEIKKELCNVDDIRRLYERLKSKHENVISIRYDQKYLDWRVRRHPSLKYEEYQVQQGGELRAYAFVTLSKGVAHISDVLSEDKYATSLLLHTILADYIGKAGRFQLMGNLKDVLAQDLFEQLNHFGFSVDKKTSKLWNFGVIDLTGKAEKHFYDIGKWHVTGLWTEGFLY